MTGVSKLDSVIDIQTNLFNIVTALNAASASSNKGSGKGGEGQKSKESDAREHV